MNLFRIFFIFGLIVFLMISFFGRVLAVDFSNAVLDKDDPDKNLVLFEPDGKKVEIDNFIDLITKSISSNGEIDSVTSYLADLNQDGKYEIISLAHYDASDSKILILDETGKMLDSKDSGQGDNLTFELQRKGFPIFFGYVTFSGLSAGAADWEFDYWNGSKIINAVGATQWIGKGGDGIEPRLVYLPEQDTMEIVSDEGKILWDKNEEKFAGRWKPLSEKELLEGCSNTDASLGHLARGKLYFHRHEYGCAIQEYNLEVDDNPNNYSAWQYLGYAYLKKGEPDAAKNYLKRAVQINPDYVMGHYNLALADFATFNEQSAVSEVEKVIQLDPAYEKTIKHDPQFKGILQSKTYLNWESQQTK
jgi:tetratricopeptide (TPR) repeat protein